MQQLLAGIFWICLIIYIINKNKKKTKYNYYKYNNKHKNNNYNIYEDYNLPKNNKLDYMNNIPQNNKLDHINNISSITYNNTIKYIDLSKYHTDGYVMTHTELLFYKELKKITDKLELLIFPQVGLERIINVYDGNYADRNRIKSRSIDYAIVNNQNCKIICCIELDDYSHNSEKSKEVDEFKNELFRKVRIPLYRIKVSSYYNLEELENRIKENLITQ